MPQVITNLDLNKNEIQNVVLQPLSTPPSDPKVGQKYFNTNDKNEYRWNGTAWVTYQAPLSTTTASTISIPNGIVKGDGSTLTVATAGTDYQAPLPSQSGNSGKYLTTNGSALSWASLPGAPVTSVNTKTGDVVLTASDVGAATSSDISAAINALDGSITGTAGAGKTLTAFSQTNGVVSATFGNISITKSQVSDFPSSMTPSAHASSATTYGIGTSSNYGHLKLSDSTASTSSTSDGTAATPAAVKAVKDAIPDVPSWAMASTKPTYTATEVGAIPTSAKGAASGVAPLNASSQIDPLYLPSYVDDVIEGYYNSTDGKFYEESSYTTEITSEAGKIYIDLSTNKSYRWGGSTYVEMPTGSTVSVSQTLTSGEEVGTITIDGTTTTLYAPEDTDTKVTQTKGTYSSYTNWRPLTVGSSSVSSATGAFSTVTSTAYTFDNLRYQPSTGTLRTKIFNVAPTVSGTTASNNHMSSDNVNNIWFRVNNGVDTVLTLYSNGTVRTVRPGGSYGGMVDLGIEATPWKDLYLDGEIYAPNSAKLLPTVMTSDNGKILAVVNGAWQAVELSSLLTIYNGETS